MSGVLLINKPKEMTSFTAVSRCRHICQEKKGGHTGTLDPNADGLMIILLGRCTKLAPYCVKNHKAYTAVFSFGKLTDTLDAWGNVLAEKEPRQHTQEELTEAAGNLTGAIEQIPPMYSAIKINGRKLYEYAREGIEIERKPRLVTVNSLHVTGIGNNLYRLDAVVSSGTYIRTLIADFASLLDEYGYMQELHRTAIESLSVNSAQTFAALEQQPVWIPEKKVIDPSYPILEASVDQMEDISHGRAFAYASEEPLLLFAKGDIIAAAYEKREDGLYHCQRGLL